VMRNQKGYVAGYNGQLVVTCQQVIVGAMLPQGAVALVDRTAGLGRVEPLAVRGRV